MADSSNIQEFDHSKYFMAHHQEIERHGEALKKLEGIPDKLDNLSKKIDALSEKLDKTEFTYLRTDVFAGERTIVYNRVEKLESDLELLWRKHDKYLYALIGTGFYILLDLLKTYMVK